MGKVKDHWESDLLTPPIPSESLNKEWMELVKKRLRKRKRLFNRYTSLVGSAAVIVLALVIFAANDDHVKNLLSNWNMVQSYPQTQTNLFIPVTSDETEQQGDELTIEKGAEVKMSKKAELSGSMKEGTIALVTLPLVPNQDYKGYVGLWSSNGELIQKFAVEGYNIMNPVQIVVEDITGDGNPDIVLETDEHANGGLGVHALHVYVYVEDKGQYMEAPLLEEVKLSYTVAFRSSSEDFLMVSTRGNRQWTVQMSPDQSKELDSSLFNQANPVHIDPVSSVDVQNNILKTKRLMWFGDLQLNALAVLVTSYHFDGQKWGIQSYSVEDIENSTIVTEME